MSKFKAAAQMDTEHSRQKEVSTLNQNKAVLIFQESRNLSQSQVCSKNLAEMAGWAQSHLVILFS